MNAGVAIAVPRSAEALKDATWDDVAPYYEELATRHLDNGNVEEWLADWAGFAAVLNERASPATLPHSVHTADPDREGERLLCRGEIEPKAEEQRSRQQGRLVKLGYTRPGLETMIQRFRN